MPETITDNTRAHRFELALGETIAFVSYRRVGGVLALTHAEVPASLAGRGLGSKLAAGVLDLVRARGERIEPRCSFIRSYIAKHPEYRDLVAGPG